MTSEKSFEPGQCYFLLGYCDRDLRIPDIHTYIYFGCNIFGQESEDCWYFQEARSFVERGPVTSPSDADWDQVMEVTKDGLCNFFDWWGLISELTENKRLQEQGKTLAQKGLGA